MGPRGHGSVALDALRRVLAIGEDHQRQHAIARDDHAAASQRAIAVSRQRMLSSCSTLSASTSRMASWNSARRS